MYIWCMYFYVYVLICMMCICECVCVCGMLIQGKSGSGALTSGNSILIGRGASILVFPGGEAHRIPGVGEVYGS